MKVNFKFDLSWKTFFGLFLIVYNASVFYFWYSTQQEFINNFIRYVALPLQNNPFGGFLTILFLFGLLIYIALFPFLIMWISSLFFPFNKSEKEKEITEARKNIEKKYKQIELEKKLKKLKDKRGR